MGKTFRRDSSFRPKKAGKVFNKDTKPWKKNKKSYQKPSDPLAPPSSDWSGSVTDTPDYT